MHADFAGPPRQNIAAEFDELGTFGHLVIHQPRRPKSVLFAQRLKPRQVAGVFRGDFRRLRPKIIALRIDGDQKRRRMDGRDFFHYQS